MKNPYSNPDNFFYTFTGHKKDLSNSKYTIIEILAAMNHEISKQTPGPFVKRKGVVQEFAKDQCLRACLKKIDASKTFRNTEKGLFFHKKYKKFSTKWISVIETTVKDGRKKQKRTNISPES